MLRKNDFIKIGRIQKPHGIKGEVILTFDSEIADELEGQETVFIEIDGGLVPFFISQFRYQHSKSAIILFQLAQTEDEIKEIIGQSVYVSKTNKPSNFNETESQLDLTGFVLKDASGKRIGIISDYIDNPDNPLLEVKPEDDSKQELLVPLHEELVINFNEQEKTITMDLPEGILDM